LGCGYIEISLAKVETQFRNHVYGLHSYGVVGVRDLALGPLDLRVPGSMGMA